MFTKRKLAKLMEKQNENELNINYDVLDRAKEEIGRNEVGEVKVIDNRKQKLIILVAACSIAILVCLSIYLGFALSPSKSNSGEPPIHYSYKENNIYQYNSVEKYNEDKSLKLLYFKDYQNATEKVRVFKDNDKDVLLNQNMLLNDTNEQIDLYVQLENNYIFDFLSQYEELNESFVVNNVNINYKTTFDEIQSLYKTFAKFNYNDNVYRISFDLNGETDWQEEMKRFLS